MMTSLRARIPLCANIQQSPEFSLSHSNISSAQCRKTALCSCAPQVSHRFSLSSAVQVQLPLSPPVCVSPQSLMLLPDPPVTFNRAQFRLWVRGQRAPGCFDAGSHSRAGRSLSGAQVPCDPEVSHTGVHPRLQVLTH